MSRKSICLSLEDKELYYLDNLAEFLTNYYGFKFTRTTTICHLMKYFRDNFSVYGDEVKADDLEGQLKIKVPF